MMAQISNPESWGRAADTGGITLLAVLLVVAFVLIAAILAAFGIVLLNGWERFGIKGFAAQVADGIKIGVRDGIALLVPHVEATYRTAAKNLDVTNRIAKVLDVEPESDPTAPSVAPVSRRP